MRLYLDLLTVKCQEMFDCFYETHVVIALQKRNCIATCLFGISVESFSVLDSQAIHFYR